MGPAKRVPAANTALAGPGLRLMLASAGGRVVDRQLLQPITLVRRPLRDHSPLAKALSTTRAREEGLR
jgi:hypothetical protein